jgi:hypothetical protein
MGRPKAHIDWGEVGRLLQAGCDGVQCAAYFGIDENTLYNRSKDDNNISFSDFLRQNRMKGDALLYAKQFECALKDKDRGMLIWLGKQRLGQKEKFENDNTHKIIYEVQYEGDSQADNIE